MGVDCRVEYGMLFLRSREAAGDAGASATWLAVPGEVDVADGARISARLVSCDGGADPVRMARELGLGSEGGAVRLDAAACGLDRSGGCVWVDAPQVGEVMCPLGMHGQSKRLSDLLNEARVPAAERPSVPVVRTSAGGRVLWVAGIRADERARCTPSSRLLLELRFRNDCARP